MRALIIVLIYDNNVNPQKLAKTLDLVADDTIKRFTAIEAKADVTSDYSELTSSIEALKGFIQNIAAGKDEIDISLDTYHFPDIIFDDTDG